MVRLTAPFTKKKLQSAAHSFRQSQYVKHNGVNVLASLFCGMVYCLQLLDGLGYANFGFKDAPVTF